jgi:hypothetical protein
MRFRSVPVKVLLFFLVSAFCISNGYSTVSVSGTYYHSCGEISEDISIKNAVVSGKVTILPHEGIEIDVDAKPAHLNGGSEQSQIYNSFQAKSHGKTVKSDASLVVDPVINAFVSSEYHLDAKVGQKSEVSQHTDITSHPGYLTFPTSQNEESITAGMTFEAFEDGQPLFEKKYIPSEEFGDYPVTFGVMKVEDDRVYMENVLATYMTWSAPGR